MNNVKYYMSLIVFLIVLANHLMAETTNVTIPSEWHKTYNQKNKRVEYKEYGKEQQMLFYNTPKNLGKRPLLVALHPWIADFLDPAWKGPEYANWCIEKNWNFIHPNFRGSNTAAIAKQLKDPTKVMGSEYVIQDIVDAVEYMKENHQVNENKIYLVGASGGGHVSLLMAGKTPEIWAGVSA